MYASWLVSPWILADMAMRVDRLHSKGLNRCPRKLFVFWSRKFVSPTRMVSDRTRSLEKWDVCALWGYFDLENGLAWPWGQISCMDNVLTDVHEKFWHFWNWKSGFPVEILNYSTRSSAKWGIYKLQGPFDLENGSTWPWGQTSCIVKV